MNSVARVCSHQKFCQQAAVKNDWFKKFLIMNYNNSQQGKMSLNVSPFADNHGQQRLGWSGRKQTNPQTTHKAGDTIDTASCNSLHISQHRHEWQNLRLCSVSYATALGAWNKSVQVINRGRKRNTSEPAVRYVHTYVDELDFMHMPVVVSRFVMLETLKVDSVARGWSCASLYPDHAPCLQGQCWTATPTHH